MSTGKRRVTVTVDPELVEAGNRAVAGGAASSLSAWVNVALADRVRHEEHLARLGDAIADYEAEFGAINADEVAAQRRADREAATVLRGKRTSKRARSKRSP